jgi:hypothetical protein
MMIVMGIFPVTENIVLKCIKVQVVYAVFVWLDRLMKFTIQAIVSQATVGVLMSFLFA